MTQPPKTIAELEAWMKSNCFNFTSYSINGHFIHEGFGIEKTGAQFAWYFTERGQKEYLNYFPSEAEIVAYAFEQIRADKWAQTHCIGFTTDLSESSELAEKLKRMQIGFFQDLIPYYGPQKPVYRTFVFGCDHQKVTELKALYYKEL